jgi:hypothetical protein
MARIEPRSERLANANPTGCGHRNSRRMIRWIGLVTAVLACLWLARGPILRGLALGLVAEDDLPEKAAVWLGGGEGSLEIAARFYREELSRVVLVARPEPDRLVQIGILPSWETIVQDELARRGVPRSAVQILGSHCRSEWDSARAFGAWLAQHPERNVILLCNRFNSRECLVVLEQTLAPGAAGRIHLIALADRRYDENDWWTTRTGVKDFFGGWLGLMYARLLGEPPRRAEPWDPDRYQSELAKRLRSGRS